MDEIYERDVVCGMYLFTTEKCKISEINGKKYFFCSETCKNIFNNMSSAYTDKGEGYFYPNNLNEPSKSDFIIF